jgi:SAM-dependent methyltransferase
VTEYGYGLNDRAEVLPFVPHVASVLEVGCGRGGFGSTLRRSRRIDRLAAIEVHPEAAAEARSYFDHVWCGDFPDVVDAIAERFDCVLFLDVLEHLVDPWEALRRTRELLKPAGLVVASIPNARVLPVSLGLLRGDWHYQSQGVLDRTHLRFFTRLSIERLAYESGFDLLSIDPINPIAGHEAVAHAVVGRSRIKRHLSDLLHLQFAVVLKPRQVGVRAVQVADRDGATSRSGWFL